jgi:hypothetical protein
VTFSPGRIHRARIGAVLSGGSLIILRDGEVLLSTYAALQETKSVLTSLPIGPLKRIEKITYDFTRDGSGPATLRALWQPEGVAEPVPLPIPPSAP